MTSNGNQSNGGSQLFNPERLRSDLARLVRAQAPKHFLTRATGSSLSEEFEHPLELKVSGPRASDLAALTASGELYTWRKSVERVEQDSGVDLRSHTKNILKVPTPIPQRFVLKSWEDAVRLDRTLALQSGSTPSLDLELTVVQTLATAVNRLAGALGSPADLSTHEAWFKALQKVEATQLDATIDALVFLNSAELAGRTLRELPVPHFGTKWIEQNLALISAVLGIDPREEASGRVTRVAITYADPHYASKSGNRRYDSLVSGDFHQQPYLPRALLIAENHECADRIPPIVGLIAARGDGKNVLNVARTLTEFFPDTPILYWGDIDEEGLAILSHLRAHFPDVHSILMDGDAWQAHKHLGTAVANDLEIARLNRAAPNLTNSEQSALHKVTAEGTPAPRIEQERIPKESVISALTHAIAKLPDIPTTNANYIDQPLW